jgi:hypothetical protein
LNRQDIDDMGGTTGIMSTRAGAEAARGLV